MLLFLGDLHLGRGSEAASRATELDAVALLTEHADRLAQPDGGLVLLGDVFNAYMEYGRMVPAGFVRIQGALAALVDRGVEVTYVVGNRDLWHLRHFREDVGVNMVRDEHVFSAYGHRVLAAHGDGLAPGWPGFDLIRPVLRSRLAYFLYRSLLPSDIGYRIARNLARRGSGAPRKELVADLREAARQVARQRGFDLVVLGHSHEAEFTNFPAGAYLNPGYWFAHRTYGILDESGPRLAQWNADHSR